MKNISAFVFLAFISFFSTQCLSQLTIGYVGTNMVDRFEDATMIIYTSTSGGAFLSYADLGNDFDTGKPITINHAFGDATFQVGFVPDELLEMTLNLIVTNGMITINYTEAMTSPLNLNSIRIWQYT